MYFNFSGIGARNRQSIFKNNRMPIQQYFCEDFFAARALFVKTCESAGLSVQSHQHPETGPEGQPLATDCTLIGNGDARKLIVLMSGTHGVETLCGSACQTGWIGQKGWQSLDADTSVLMIHAINCWGAAHLRRNTEGNVDLARNFLDFDQPLPENPAYEAIHAAVSCTEYRGTRRDHANQLMADYRDEHGIDNFVNAIMGGQYRYEDGMSYGGERPVWSNDLLRTLLSPYKKTAEKVSVIEYHSGLGPYGYGMAVTMQTGFELEHVRAVYGHWVEAPNEHDGGSNTQLHQINGHPTDGFRKAFPDSELTAIVLEYGTYPPMMSLPVMVDDHWLTLYGDIHSDEGREIKSRLHELHYPQNTDWRQAIWDRSVQVINQAIHGLS